jgi:hypothetical protein
MSVAETKLLITFDFRPGQLVFDYYNVVQLADVAQSLGLDLALTRSINREEGGKSGAKATIKIPEVSGEKSNSTSESTTIAGTLPTAVFLQILGQLDHQMSIRSVDLDGDSDAVSFLLGNAVNGNEWLLLTGVFTVDAESVCLRGGAGPEQTTPTATVHIPKDDTELTPTGKIRLRKLQRIKADVLAQAEGWSEERNELTVIAHAVLTRVGGDPRFSWGLTRYDTNSSGAGSDWD